MNFEVISEITNVETFARGLSVRIRDYLNDKYGGGRRLRWRHRKGYATVRYENGAIYYAEVHWFEAHGLGMVERTVKRQIRRLG